MGFMGAKGGTEKGGEAGMKILSQFLVLLLMIDAGWVAYGLINGLFVQWFIAAYWIILTAKNAVDWIAGRKQK